MHPLQAMAIAHGKRLIVFAVLAALACDSDSDSGPPTPDTNDPTEALGEPYLACAHPNAWPFRCDEHYGSLPIVEGFAEVLCLGGVVVDACSPQAAPNFAGACWIEGEMAGEWSVILTYAYGMSVEAAESGCEATVVEPSAAPGVDGRTLFFPPW